MAHMHPVRRKLVLRYLMIRDGVNCCYCDRELSRLTATLEHIIPSSIGGTSNIWNLALACRRCNNDRGDDNFFETLGFSGADQKEIAYYRGIIGNYYCMYQIHRYISDVKFRRDLLTEGQLKAALSVLGRLLKPLSIGHRLKVYGIGRRSWA